MPCELVNLTPRVGSAVRNHPIGFDLPSGCAGTAMSPTPAWVTTPGNARQVGENTTYGG